MASNQKSQSITLATIQRTFSMVKIWNLVHHVWGKKLKILEKFALATNWVESLFSISLSSDVATRLNSFSSDWFLYIHHNFLSHSSVMGYLGYFQVWTIMNCTACFWKSTGRQPSVYSYITEFYAGGIGQVFILVRNLALQNNELILIFMPYNKLFTSAKRRRKHVLMTTGDKVWASFLRSEGYALISALRKRVEAENTFNIL